MNCQSSGIFVCAKLLLFFAQIPSGSMETEDSVHCKGLLNATYTLFKLFNQEKNIIVEGVYLRRKL